MVTEIFEGRSPAITGQMKWKEQRSENLDSKARKNATATVQAKHGKHPRENSSDGYEEQGVEVGHVTKNSKDFMSY